jgi:glucose-6-phosphate 1-dehydrogenase
MADQQDKTTKTPTALPPSVIVIFGVTGDLSKRYLLPSLYHLFRQHLLHDKTRLVGVSRRDITADEVVGSLEAGLRDAGEEPDAAILDAIRSRCTTRRLDMTDPADYQSLRGELDDIETEQGVCMNRLFYLSIPPEAYGDVITNMGKADYRQSCQHGTAASRLLVEKPFGRDLASAESLIATTAQAFDEEQIFRIDHYLAKETAQNITAFRFDNPLFEKVWNREHVSKIDIVASEKIGVEGRGNLYERQGALRDVIQNHLLQLLAVATMEEPAGGIGKADSQAFHAAKLAILQAVQPVTAGEHARRGQYAGYRDEAGNPDSFVETFAALETTIGTSRWQGVPVTLRTGKSMAAKHTCVSFTFTDPSSSQTNELTFRIQPDEGIGLQLLAKKPGFERELQPVRMNFAYEQHFDAPQPNAYERVLVDAIRGDRTLFATSDEVLAAWRVIDGLVQAWSTSADGLAAYEPGSDIDSL